MSQYLIVRLSLDNHNGRYLTNYDSFRYKAELQGGEEFVVFETYAAARKMAEKLNNDCIKAAKDFKDSLGKKGDGLQICSSYTFFPSRKKV